MFWKSFSSFGKTQSSLRIMFENVLSVFYVSFLHRNIHTLTLPQFYFLWIYTDTHKHIYQRKEWHLRKCWSDSHFKFAIYWIASERKIILQKHLNNNKKMPSNVNAHAMVVLLLLLLSCFVIYFQEVLSAPKAVHSNISLARFCVLFFSCHANTQH